MRADELQEFRKNVSVGLDWLGSEQPEGAILTHHGIFCSRKFSDVSIGLTPRGFANGPVLIFRVKPQYVNHEPNVFKAATIQQITEAVSGLCGICSSWNGLGCESYSIVPDRWPCDSLLAAVKRYLNGCQEHVRESVFCRCAWFETGSELLVKPEGWA